jgi:hypothetical protein
VLEPEALGEHGLELETNSMAVGAGLDENMR